MVWRRTGNVYFPYAARDEGCWLVLRINAYPDHEMWTLFRDGHACDGFDDFPGDPSGSLSADESREALTPVLALTVFGSEHGTPCASPACCA